MIRTIITPDEQQISILLPKGFIGKRVEVIAFSIDEPSIVDDIETHFASEHILSTDWLTPEEDQAWENL
jgi:hypothetical protein